MTPEAQRIAIAEACGWKIEPHPQGRRLIHPDGHVVNNHYAEDWRLPDYLNDLNAMHEAEEKILRGNGWSERLHTWSNHLLRIVQESNWPLWGKDAVNCRYFTAHATAAQRAEAFLRTIGKWEDSMNESLDQTPSIQAMPRESKG